MQHAPLGLYGNAWESICPCMIENSVQLKVGLFQRLVDAMWTCQLSLQGSILQIIAPHSALSVNLHVLEH